VKQPASEPRHLRTPAGGGRERVQPAEGREVFAERCEACGTAMYGLHCKLVCPNCGFKRDCSDP
jgi:rubrerythrin